MRACPSVGRMVGRMIRVMIRRSDDLSVGWSVSNQLFFQSYSCIRSCLIISTGLTLHVKRIKVYPEVLKKIETSLDSQKIARYFFENRVTRSYYLASGRSSFRLEGVLQTNFLPSYAIVGVIDSTELRGSYHFSNYTFKPMGLNELYFQSANIKFPADPYKPDWTSKRMGYIREYLAWYGGNGG